MRFGINPAKENRNITLDNYHRVVIPVYIPNFEDYFAEAFDIFKMCIESLLDTIHEKTRVTIYNNASHQLVKNYIDDLYRKHESIDQVFHSKVNLGKINAILASVKGNVESLITITDADVLFKFGWQSEVEKLYNAFPEAGMISPVPSSKSAGHFTSNVWAKFFFKGKIAFDDVVDPDGLHKFDLSISEGRSQPLYDAIHYKKYITVKSTNGTKACVGCGHFVATMRREVFDKGSNSPSFIKIHGGIDNKYIDIPNEQLGYLRLATKGNFAFHMGNKLEPWMLEELNNLQQIRQSSTPKPISIGNSRPVSFLYRRIALVFKYLLYNSYSRQLLFQSMGMREKF